MRGASVEEYVVMANLERRNLTRQQRRDLAGQLAVMLEKAQKDKPKEERIDTTAKAAESAGVSRRTAAEAKKEAVHAVSYKTPAAVSKPKSKTTTAKVILPGKIIENQQKALDSLTKYGHNWLLTTLEELADTTAKCLNELNRHIANNKKEAAEKAQKAADEAKLAADLME